MSANPEIALIGGGTGSFTLLQGLKDFTPNISAIVNMSDNGGSTGDLRDEFGVLPPGDIRQCLVALSEMPEVREIFDYRFGGEGPLSGHSLGNLILAGLEMQNDCFEEALRIASRMLQVTGQVIPVTLEKHLLVMKDGDWRVEGENVISDRPILTPSPLVTSEPPAFLNPKAEEAIHEADMVVIAPGNLYGSLIPALAVNGMAEAFQESPAQKVMVSNLVTKLRQTDGWHVVDYVRAIEEYIGEDQIDVVLYNQDPPSEELLWKYAVDGEYPVATDEDRFGEVAAQAIGADFVAKDVVKQDPNDLRIRRTLIRHNGQEVGHQLMKLFSTRDDLA